MASNKRQEAEARLPEDLKAVFDTLVLDYQGSAFEHHRQPFVSYVVLADLVRQGWRKSGPDLDAKG